MSTKRTGKSGKGKVPERGVLEALGSLPPLTAAVLLLGFCFLLYANSLDGRFVFDDTVIIQGNRSIQGLGPAHLAEIFGVHYWKSVESQGGLYRPMVMLTFAVNYALGGENPFGYHLVNLFVHALNGILLFLVVRGLFRRPLLALASAVLFLAHPIRTEGVASIVGRAESLSAFFVLLAWWAYVEGRERKKTSWVLAAAAAFLLATLTKEGAFSFLALVPLTDYFAGTGSFRERYAGAAMRYLPFACSLVISLGIRAAVLGGFAPLYINPASNPLVEAGGWTRFLTASWVLVKYLSLLIAPIRLSADYSYNQIPLVSGILDWRGAAGVTTLTALVAASAISARRAPFLFFCSLVFFTSFLGISNWIRPIGTIMAERLMYFPSIGFTCAIAFVLCEGWARERLRFAAQACSMALMLFYSLGTIDRNSDWQDHYSLFGSAAGASPNSFLAQTNFAMVLLNEKGDVRGAIGHAERAASIRPEDPSAHFTLGEANRRMGDLSRAAQEFETVVRLAPATSGGTQALRALVSIRETLGQAAEAALGYEKLLEWRPKDVGAMIDYSRMLARTGKHNQARGILERARLAAPDDPGVEEELRRIHARPAPR